ncbi:MAG: multifunctional CCA tRNA nucleotidyl transferase/2'3'-cyclic phosphodiesterase/2'nucleotidase/phosphatase [Halobacteriovoraceae bacterium]|nr:multifunctional CCA tRNA nucleotidyl transferase/2'3'-cyclic phosphodiesterase/2'nucleotidase/phosphatase [Halobacteriovoraceae bacterium]|tara:strand:+ start:802 stop:1884 length:1083 start_codon:yes stop_codon:yes gene_type:complete
MKVYLVGGAIRDEFLGLPVKDRDYVVVGSSVEEMESLGFEKVGQDFPVFIHPETKEEYALARTEKKKGVGYKGFEFEWKGVTLEEDLKRRDLTINSLARDVESGEVIDKFGGLNDLKLKIIQHVSVHFIEDPLRVLRVARFFAYLPQFSVATKTKILCEKISQSGEIESLTPERVWLETQKALKAASPWLYFDFLHDVNALGILGDKERLNLEKLKLISQHTDDIEIRFASLFVPLKHEEDFLKSVIGICQKLKVPKRIEKLCRITAKFSYLLREETQMDSENIYELIKETQAMHDTALLDKFIFILRGHPSHNLYFSKLVHYLKQIDISKKLEGVPTEKKQEFVKDEMLKSIEEFNLKF